MLLQVRRYSGAYYLAGYAVECALKAAIAKSVRRHEFPDLNAVKDSYTHNLERLLKLAGLDTALRSAMNQNGNLLINWAVVKDWSEKSRYQMNHRQEATDLIGAINDPQDGMLAWLNPHS